MPPLPSRQSLEAMKRADLQKLCKDYGVRANLKSEALIDLLLDTQSMSVSTRQSSRAGPSRISSIIIHDTDDEADKNLSEEEHRHPGVHPNQPVATQPPPPVRTRKAKEMQTRLGVGRPVAAGGAGPRAITKSLSVSRSRRGKPSRSLKQIEATIQEEPEESTSNIAESHPSLCQSYESHEQNHLQDATPEVSVLQRQIETLKQELEKVQHLSSEVEYLRAQLASVTELQHAMNSLTTEVQELREKISLLPHIQAELKELRETWMMPRTPPNPSTQTAALQPPPSPGGFRDSPSPSNGPLTRVPDTVVANSPTIGTSILGKRTTRYPSVVSVLGKRHLDPAESTSSGIVMNEESSSGVKYQETSTRHMNKRLKLARDHVDTGESKTSSVQPESTLDTGNPESSHTQSSTTRPYNFKVFQGPEDPTSCFSESRSPANPLPEFFGAPSPTEDILLDTATPTRGISRNTNENQNHFTFSLLPPATSTPNSSLYMPSFPYPDPPQSPSPTGVGAFHPTSDHVERTDPFKSFGLPSPTRRKPSTTSASQQQGFINPVALTQDAESSASGNPLTSSGATAGVDVTALATGLSISIEEDKGDSHPTRRTMYGTELEGDTRFGDFGVKGVASGFWTSGRF
ncbi:hypothetical protein BDQ17DRAFT_1320215 [Cyathus striatus]|nr:hypothetical protein BDQ17DRAFT_1320215 [Cyathus striatus]